MSQHTPEPWRYAVGNGRHRVMSGPASLTITIDPTGKDPGMAKANAQRIVACVNACAGIADPSVVPELVANLSNLLEWVEGEREYCPDDFDNERLDADIAGASSALARAKGGSMTHPSKADHIRAADMVDPGLLPLTDHEVDVVLEAEGRGADPELRLKASRNTRRADAEGGDRWLSDLDAARGDYLRDQFKDERL